MSNTYRVVVVHSDRPQFNGASGIYAAFGQAMHELGEIARTWVGLAEPVWRHDADGVSFAVRHNNVTHTYSILTERKSA